MEQRPVLLLAIAVLMAGMSAGPAAALGDSAASGGEVATAEELDQLRAEVESLRQQLKAAPWIGNEPAKVSGTGEIACACEQEPDAHHGFYAGGAIIWAKPHMKESFQASIRNWQTSTLTLEPFSFDYEPSFRVWLGVQNADGFGLRVRYWQLQQDGNPLSLPAALPNLPGANVTTVIFPANITTLQTGDELIAANDLGVYTVDVEGTKAMALGSAELVGGLGLRYAALEQTNAARVQRGGATLSSLDWSRQFHGLGVTAGADARQLLTCRGLAVIGSAHASLLYGEKTLHRTVVGDVTPAIPPASNPAVVDLPAADEVSGIFDMGLGLEWRHTFERLGTVVAQGLYEGQLWTDGGAPTLTFLGFEGFGVSLALLR